VAGYTYTLVLRADGTIRGWGNGAPTNLPAGLSATMGDNPIVSLGVAQHHAVALQRDGTVTAWFPTNSGGAVSNFATLTVPVGLKVQVPMGGADSDGDGWANEAELRVGSDPLSRTSQPVKASFGVTFNYSNGMSLFTRTNRVSEGTDRAVGTLRILDTMGRLESSNQPVYSVELGQGATNLFELVGRDLRFRSNPAYDGVTSNNVYRVDVLVRDSIKSATLTTTLNVEVGNVAPQITPPTSFSVNENVPLGTVVGTMTATETNVTWSISPSNNLFKIDAQSGRILTKAPLDYEALTNKTITLSVQVTDAGGLSGFPTNVTVTVNDLPEDFVAPVLTLNGISPMRVGQNQTFTDPGATVTDNLDPTRTVYASNGTVNTAVLGTYVLTYTASDAAGNAALPLTRQVMVDGWTTIDGTVLTRYAIGGASSPSQMPEPPSLALGTNTNGQPVLTLTALVRVNDAALRVRGQAAATIPNWGTNEIAGTASNVTQSNVPPGFQRQAFTAPATDTRQFLRLKVSR